MTQAKRVTTQEWEAWYTFEAAAGRLATVIERALQDHAIPVAFLKDVTHAMVGVDRAYDALNDARVKAMQPYTDEAPDEGKHAPTITVGRGLRIRASGPRTTPVRELTNEEYDGSAE